MTSHRAQHTSTFSNKMQFIRQAVSLCPESFLILVISTFCLTNYLPEKNAKLKDAVQFTFIKPALFRYRTATSD